MSKSILAINPGSTSTKVAFFQDYNMVLEQNVPFVKTQKKEKVHVLDEFEPRMESIYSFLDKAGIKPEDIDIFVARASTPGVVNYGAYSIDKHLVQALCFCNNPTFHASSLSPIMAYELAQTAEKQAIFYDAVSADRALPEAHVSGIPSIPRRVGSHNLNTRMVGREVAEKLGKRYEECKFIIAHMGGGFSVSSHCHGIISDCTMSDEGPMSPQRCGRMNFIQMFQMCFSGDYTKEDMQRLTDSGGLLSYLGAADTIEVEKQISEGDEKAEFMYRVMAYQLSKAIGEQFAGVYGEADRIIFTGGLANSKRFTEMVKEYVGKIAPVEIVPGEREMLALAHGGLRVLNGEEEVQYYTIIPDGFENMEALKADFVQRRPDLLDEPMIKKMMAG